MCFQCEINLHIGHHVPLIFCPDLPSSRPDDRVHSKSCPTPTPPQKKKKKKRFSEAACEEMCPYCLTTPAVRLHLLVLFLAVFVRNKSKVRELIKKYLNQDAH